MKSPRFLVVAGLGSILSLLLALAALAQTPATANGSQAVGAPTAAAPTAGPKPSPFEPAAVRSSVCADPIGELELSKTAAVAMSHLELGPPPAQPLCVHHCPPGYLYNCICMVCYKCPSGYFFDDSLCACAPI